MSAATGLSIPAPVPGPDPWAEVRAARALLLRVGDSYCPALERYISSVGVLEAAEQLAAGVVAVELAGQVSVAGVRAAVAAVRGDGEAAAECGARLLIPEDPQWPGAAALPGVVGLWVRGDGGYEVLDAAPITVTGSRAASPYGVHVATDVAGELAGAGHTVVAGGGLGIDAAAHRGALAARGVTVAVVAGGVDRADPVAHAALLERIAERGLVVSAVGPATLPSRHRARGRARVLGGLGRASVVVEASTRSGALQVAAAARGLGRPVMAVPGPVTSAGSAGAHRLIGEGARLVTGGADILDALGTPGAGMS
ncbi:DNA-processing protein DprA [Pseudonocardia sp. NPDC049635]|uniref:DNA-processing protein DprA n=1 Tax=Pseudonocardia sp. NPDC049635 TaxID=3155506 RepID=UPI0033FBE9DA